MTNTLQSRPSGLVGLAEAARYFGVSTKSIRRWIADGRLPAYRLGPRIIKINTNDLQTLLQPTTASKEATPAADVASAVAAAIDVYIMSLSPDEFSALVARTRT